LVKTNSPSKKISDSVDSLRKELFAFCQDLVRIPSLPGHELEAQRFVASKMKKMGLRVESVTSVIDELKRHPAFSDDGVPFKSRLNVIGAMKGTRTADSGNASGRTSLILNGHMDVVSPGNEKLWSDSPWSGKIRNGKLYGRGSCDMKAGLAAGIFALEALQLGGMLPSSDVLMESVIGEETGGVGTLTTIVKGYTADAAIILEPTRLALCPVQAGALTFRIRVQGRAAHAALKSSGVSAIEKFFLILNATNQLERQRHLAYRSPLYQDRMNVAPISFGTIKGGIWHSTVPDELIVEGRFGVFPGEPVEAARNAFAEALRSVSEGDPWLSDHRPSLEWFEAPFESGRTDLDAHVVKSLSRAHEKITGERVKLHGVPYGTDLRLFTNHAKIPAVLYGPGDALNAHTVNEFVSLDAVVACTKVLAQTIYEYGSHGAPTDRSI
jgi:acetylornithine deacetylase